MGLTPRERFVIDHLERVAAALTPPGDSDLTGDNYSEGRYEGYVAGLQMAADTLRHEAELDDAEEDIWGIAS